MRAMLLLGLAAAVAGCQTLPEAPPQAPVVHSVEVPVIVPCINTEDVPKWPKSASPPKGAVNQLAAGAEVDLLELERYARKLRALVKGCER